MHRDAGYSFLDTRCLSEGSEIQNCIIEHRVSSIENQDLPKARHQRQETSDQ